MSIKWLILSSLCIIAVSTHALKCENEFYPWMSFQDAKAFIQSQNVQNNTEFAEWKRAGKRPKNFPSAPNKVYKDQWKSWMHFFGTEKMSFQSAKAFIQNLRIKSKEQFRNWVKSGQKPKNFPSTPDKTYKKEWISWGDFLGTGNTVSKKQDWMSFHDAKTFIQSEDLKSSTEFRKWKKSGKKPTNFPSVPEKIYKDEWISWGDFLGTGYISTRTRKWMSFQEAKTFIQSQGVTNASEFNTWKKAKKRPKNFPSAPWKTYKNEWISLEHFLGTKKEWMSFQEAKTFIQSEGIQSSREFRAWKKAGKRPRNFPSNPDKTYKGEWISWSDFLGTGNTAYKKRDWMSFQDAKAFIQNLGIRSKGQFQKWAKSGKRPKNFPSNPMGVYANKWKNWGDFLGTNNTVSYMKYKTAKEYIQIMKFKKTKDFIEWLESDDRPINFPPNPEQIYSEWISVKDFLSIEVQEYISYKEATTFVQQLGITSPRDFFETKKNESDIFPENFPPNPKVFYTNTGEWIDWNDFLGLTNTSQEKINSSEQAQDFIDWLKSQDDTDENIEDDQNIEEDFPNNELNNQEENSTNDFFNKELNQEVNFTDDFLTND